MPRRRRVGRPSTSTRRAVDASLSRDGVAGEQGRATARGQARRGQGARRRDGAGPAGARGLDRRSVPRVRTARFCGTRAAAPSRPRSAAASAIAASVPRAESSPTSRIRPDGEQPGEQRRQHRDADGEQRRSVATSVPRPPVTSRPGVAHGRSLGGIPDAAHGADRAGRRRASRAAGRRGRRRCGSPAVGGVAPHLAEQLLAAEDPSRPAHQVAEQVELGGGQRDRRRPATDARRSPGRGERHRPTAAPRGGRGVPARAAQHAATRATSSRGENGLVT